MGDSSIYIATVVFGPAKLPKLPSDVPRI
jgi:Sec-independent protein translocase protein TatA